MSSVQLEVLDDFFLDDIKGGALSFDFPKPRDHAVILVVVFTGPPGWTNLGGDNYDVTLEMEIQP